MITKPDAEHQAEDIICFLWKPTIYLSVGGGGLSKLRNSDSLTGRFAKPTCSHLGMGSVRGEGQESNSMSKCTCK